MTAKRARPITLKHLRAILDILDAPRGGRTAHYEFLCDSRAFHSIALLFRSPPGYQKHHDLAMEYMRRVDAELQAWRQARDAEKEVA